MPPTKVTKKKAPAKRATAKKKAAPKKDNLTTILRQFLTLRVQRETIEDREADLKKELQEAVEANGYADDKGHFWLDLDESVNVAGYGEVSKLKRERRATVRVDETAAEALLQDKGLWDDCTATVVVLDEEEIRKAHYKGLLSDEDIATIFPTTVSWAFKPVKS